MEPIISPMVFYWIYVLSTLNVLFYIGAFMSSGIFLFITPIILFAFQGEERREYMKYIKYLIVVCVVCTAGLLLTPKEDTMYKMLVAHYVTPDNIAVVGDTVEKSIQKIIDMIVKAKL